MAYEVTVGTLGPRTLAAVRRRVAMNDIGREFRPALDKVWAFLKKNPGLRTDGHNVFLYHRSVLGVDASHAMIAFAARTFPSTTHPNLAFQVVDAAQLPLADEFDLIVSFNCLHWVRDQAAALRGIRAALGPSGSAHLRFVSRGARTRGRDRRHSARGSVGGVLPRLPSALPPPHAGGVSRARRG